MGDGAGSLEKIGKLPFSNYDVVIYFGVGICSLPFFSRYILASPNHKLPTIFDGYTDPLINSIVSIVALLFGVYILGHGIAVLSSLFIEQFLYRTAGTPSQLIVRSAIPKPTRGNPTRDALRKQACYYYGTNITPADVIRILFIFLSFPFTSYFIPYTFLDSTRAKSAPP